MVHHLHTHTRRVSIKVTTSFVRVGNGVGTQSRQMHPKRDWIIYLKITHTTHGNGIFTYMNGCFLMVKYGRCSDVGKNTIHGWYGLYRSKLLDRRVQ